jgi:hypothetical protein
MYLVGEASSVKPYVEHIRLCECTALRAGQVLDTTSNDPATTTTTTTAPPDYLDLLKDDLFKLYKCSHNYEVMDMKFPMDPGGVMQAELV